MTNMKTAGAYGGYLAYHPRLKLPDHRMLELRDLLVEKTHIEEPENPSVPIDWFCNNDDGPPYHTREGVLLYRDGGDIEEPAVLFFRTGSRPTHAPPGVHVPAPEHQAMLAEAALDLWRTNAGTASPLTVINQYLEQVLNDETQWEPYEFTDDYAGTL